MASLRSGPISNCTPCLRRPRLQMFSRLVPWRLGYCVNSGGEPRSGEVNANSVAQGSVTAAEIDCLLPVSATVQGDHVIAG